MKRIETIAKADNFCAINIGKMSELGEYVLELGPEVIIPGKVFCGATLGATGAQFSMQSFAPGTETGFLHTHKEHEELYFFLGGKGEFQVDGQSPFARAAWCAWPRPDAARYATTAKSRW
mgnify:CR=1 FL=1